MPEVPRRIFVKQVATAAAAVATNPIWSNRSLGAQAEDNGIALAIATICVDGFGAHRHKPSFEFIPQLGYRNVEFNLWYPDLIVPDYIDSLKERCQQTGLTPISIQGSGFGGEGRTGVIKDLSHKLVLLDRCEQLGCRILKCTGSRRGTAGGLKSIIEVLRELAPVAEAKGIQVALENHANNTLERIGDYEEIFAAIDSPKVGMCLDTGHFEGVSVDLGEVVDTFRERILHIDLKDCRERGKGHDTVPFGQGVTDFDGFLTHAINAGYRGYLVIEQAWTELKGDWVNDLKAARNRFEKWER